MRIFGVTSRRIIVATIFATIIIFSAPLIVTSTIAFTLASTMAKIEVQGHRGARSVLPENTLAAFQYALEAGVDTLELDMGVTNDGVVVVVHDQKINPIICEYKNGEPINDELWIHQLSLQQIKSIDCGSRINPRFPKQKLLPGSTIPTLAEVFQLIKDSPLDNAKTVLFNIETKSNPERPYAQPMPKDFVKAVLAVVNEYNMAGRVCLQSFDHRTLIEAHHQAPQILRSALFEESPDNWVLAAQQAKAQIVSPNFQLLDAESVITMQQAGLRVIPWTANTAEQWQSLIDLGVDGIISDDPKALLEFLGR